MIHKFITEDVAITAVQMDFYSWQQIIATVAIHIYAEVRTMLFEFIFVLYLFKPTTSAYSLRTKITKEHNL